MRNLFLKISKALESIEQEKGKFKIKCLVAREVEEPLWDLVLSADWFKPNQKAALDYLADRVLADLDYDCMIAFSGIVTVAPDTDNELTQTLLKIQNHYRQGRYVYPSTEDFVVIETPLAQARLVVPLDHPKRAEILFQSDVRQKAIA